VRPPLTRIPRGLIRLSSTAEVTLTLVREAGRRRVALPGAISRRLGTGERDISLTVLLGGRRTFAAGRYWVIATARTADGRGATTQAVLRVLRPKRGRR
jgi:hypothetical protein